MGGVGAWLLANKCRKDETWAWTACPKVRWDLNLNKYYNILEYIFIHNKYKANCI